MAHQQSYEVHIYSQRVEGIGALEEFEKGGASSLPAGEGQGTGPPAAPPGRIFWHKVSDLPGPHLVKYLWWLLANQFQRRRDQKSRGLRYDLVYSPGINCWDADVIMIHIVFDEFYGLVRDELRLRNLPVRAWPRPSTGTSTTD